jgi:ketosteroid isomerase-like protein
MNKKPEEIINFYTDDCRVLPPGVPAVQGREGKQVYNLVMNGMCQCTVVPIGKLRINRK